MWNFDNAGILRHRFFVFWRIIASRSVLLLCVASGSYFLQGYLSFDSLRAHRVILAEFRDANYLLAVLVFILAYTLFVAFSVPGGLILSLSGGFLFATFPGVLYNMVGATLGASAIFLAARWGFGANLGGKIGKF